MRGWQYALMGVAGGSFIGFGLPLISARSVRSSIYRDKKPRVTGPLVSVVIPTLEEQHALPSLLESIENQNYSPIEVIIVDSSSLSSHEATKRIAQKHGATVIYVPPGNISRARNEGAGASKGEILVFADADCFLASDYIGRIARAICKEGAKLAHGQEVLLNAPFYYDATFAWSHILVKPRMLTTGRGIAVPRNVFFGVGGYNENVDPRNKPNAAHELEWREDLEFGRRVNRKYGRIKVVKGAYVGVSARREKVLGYGGWHRRGVRVENGVRLVNGGR